MESVRLILDPDEGKTFDSFVHNDKNLQDFGDLTVVTKDAGTEEGNPCVCLCFTVMLPDGKTKMRAQTVTTVRLLQMALAGLKGRYPNV